ncbi:MAG: imelysin family protein [Tenacibaculum sp.]
MKKILGISCLALASLFVGCSDDNENMEEKATKATFIEGYAKIVAANYDDSYTTAVAMKTKIDAFLAAPSAASLKEAKDAWLYARDFYGQTEAFRVAEGPIDNEDLLATEGQINAWPLDEAFIDYVSDNRGGSVQNGLIGDTNFVITEANIIAENANDAEEKEVTTGWHAIEFLLWGQDLNYNPQTHTLDNFASAGNRAFTDYTTADFADRRKQYLEVVTNLLVKDLKDLKTTWAEGGSYRTTFAKLDEKAAITNILSGIGFISNGEVALERLDPAINEGQENEHSCFSDNTNQDMWANVHGINNVIAGTYKRADGSKVTGTSLVTLVATLNTNVSKDLETKAQATLSKLDALLALNKPFDEIIHNESTGSNGPAEQLSSALKDQGKAIAEAARSLDTAINIGS